MVSTLAILWACVQEVPEVASEGVVTVIFKDAPEQRSTGKVGRLNSAYESIVTYVDSDGCEAGFNPRSIGLDTLDVPTYRGYAEILHLYQVCEEIPYLLIDGDTVIVTYDHDSRPKLKSNLCGHLGELVRSVQEGNAFIKKTEGAVGFRKGHIPVYFHRPK